MTDESMTETNHVVVALSLMLERVLKLHAFQLKQACVCNFKIS